MNPPEHNRPGLVLAASAAVVFILFAGACGTSRNADAPARLESARDASTISTDGVTIAYTTRGAGAPALVFIHGGFADRTFWRKQLDAFADRYRVITVDLAGHGASGRNRHIHMLAHFAEDVVAVLDAEHVTGAVLIGNSMGGPVALEAARLAPGRTVAVVGVDTLQDGTQKIDPKMWAARTELFRADFPKACAEMTASLFHRDADAALVAEVKKSLCAHDGPAAAGILSSFDGYDMPAAMRAVNAPIFCINGDLFPTNVAANRTIVPNFDAVVMAHCGHYPMLERPAEFNRHLENFLAGVGRAAR